LKELHLAIISSSSGFLSKEANTAAICPFETGTRRHWVVMEGDTAGTITPSKMLPIPSAAHSRIFLLSAYIRYDIVYHFRPSIKGFSGTGYSLIGARKHFFHSEVHKRMQRRNIALNGTIGFDGDKPPAYAPSLSEGFYYSNMLRVDFGTTMGTSSPPRWALLLEITGHSRLA
jgi:hypothetical protein